MPNLLIVGGGGREHALAWKLLSSPLVQTIYCCPGNGGTSHATNIINASVPLSAANGYKEVCEFCIENQISLAIIGPEEPLCNGIADALQEAQIDCFGPSKAAAQLEGSKRYSKELMQKYDIPTAYYKAFKSSQEIEEAIQFTKWMWNEQNKKVVVKASGLAAGKGVTVPTSLQEAISAIEENLTHQLHGESSEEIVIEEFLEGNEVSILVLSDGDAVVPLLASHDYKRIYKNDEGPNTGGMGAVCPTFRLSAAEFDTIIENIVKPTINAMKSEGHPFTGCLYTGIMLTADGPKVLEYNVRFGDPETQAILSLLKSDLYTLMKACCKKGDRKLSELEAKFQEDSVAVAVVMAAEGYPGKYVKGEVISGLKCDDNKNGVQVFHAGTAVDENGAVKTSGGRVLAVTAVDKTIEEARSKAYGEVEQIVWRGSQYRSDIGLS